MHSIAQTILNDPGPWKEAAHCLEESVLLYEALLITTTRNAAHSRPGDEAPTCQALDRPLSKKHSVFQDDPLPCMLAKGLQLTGPGLCRSRKVT